ncbi:MAG: DUF4410 domain-containing protein [Desulfuromonas sp.]
MFRSIVRSIVILLTLLAAGCGHHGNAASRGAGKLVAVVVDPGLTEELDGTEMAQYQQVADFMRKDLVSRLQRQGYSVETLKERADFVSGYEQHLLAVKIARYRSGNKTARISGGFGAGSTSLDISYRIVAASGRTLKTATDGVGCSRDWNYCCRALNERMVKVLGVELSVLD